MGGLPSAKFQTPGVRGIHSGEARTLGVRTNRPWANPPKADSPPGGLLGLLVRLWARLLAMLVIVILVILARLLVRLLGNSSWTLLAFYRIFGLSWETILSRSRSCIHTWLLVLHPCFFSENRPLEESPHQSCSTLRGEVDSSIPRVSGGFWVVVFEETENSSVSNWKLAR
jgi:hypothetical protein